MTENIFPSHRYYGWRALLSGKKQRNFVFLSCFFRILFVSGVQIRNARVPNFVRAVEKTAVQSVWGLKINVSLNQRFLKYTLFSPLPETSINPISRICFATVNARVFFKESKSQISASVM